jgi:hypothetical protein
MGVLIEAVVFIILGGIILIPLLMMATFIIKGITSLIKPSPKKPVR